MSIILSLIAIIIAGLSLYITFLFQNNDIKTEVQYAIDELIRFIKRITGDKVYRNAVKVFGEVGEYLVQSGTLTKTKHSKFKASTTRWRPSICFCIVGLISLYSLLGEFITYIVELTKKLCEIFL